MAWGMDTKVFKTVPVIQMGGKAGSYWSGTTQKLCVHILPPHTHRGNPANVFQEYRGQNREMGGRGPHREERIESTKEP